jgi:hypothetical protein
VFLKQVALHLMALVAVVQAVLEETENQEQEMVVLDLVIQYQDHHCSMQAVAVEEHVMGAELQVLVDLV